MPVEHRVGQAWIVVTLEAYGRRGFSTQQVINVFADLVDIDESLLWSAVGSEHRVDERGQSVGLADDDPGVLPQVCLLQLALQELGGTAQAAEWILDLVRELPNHESAAIETRQQIV